MFQFSAPSWKPSELITALTLLLYTLYYNYNTKSSKPAKFNRLESLKIRAFLGILISFIDRYIR